MKKHCSHSTIINLNCNANKSYLILRNNVTQISTHRVLLLIFSNHFMVSVENIIYYILFIIMLCRWFVAQQSY